MPRLGFERLDRDLVGISEIAERTGRSRQNVTQWIKGERHANLDPFPAPEGVIGQARVWLWTEVNEWLDQLDLADDVCYPSRDDMVDIDHMLLHDRLRTLERDPIHSVYIPTGVWSGYVAAVTVSEGWTPAIGSEDWLNVSGVAIGGPGQLGPGEGYAAGSMSTNVRVEATR